MPVCVYKVCVLVAVLSLSRATVYCELVVSTCVHALLEPRLGLGCVCVWCVCVCVLCVCVCVCVMCTLSSRCVCGCVMCVYVDMCLCVCTHVCVCIHMCEP